MKNLFVVFKIKQCISITINPSFSLLLKSIYASFNENIINKTNLIKYCYSLFYITKINSNIFFNSFYAQIKYDNLNNLA